MDETGKHCRIFLDADEYADIERIAAYRDMTAEEWIADVVRQAQSDYHKQVKRIRQTIDEALQCQHPVELIEEMIREIHGEPQSR